MYSNLLCFLCIHVHTINLGSHTLWKWQWRLFIKSFSAKHKQRSCWAAENVDKHPPLSRRACQNTDMSCRCFMLRLICHWWITSQVVGTCASSQIFWPCTLVWGENPREALCKPSPWTKVHLDNCLTNMFVSVRGEVYYVVCLQQKKMNYFCKLTHFNLQLSFSFIDCSTKDLRIGSAAELTV